MRDHAKYAEEHPRAQDDVKIIFCEYGYQAAYQISPADKSEDTPPLRAKRTDRIVGTTAVGVCQCEQAGNSCSAQAVYKEPICIFRIGIPDENKT